MYEHVKDLDLKTDLWAVAYNGAVCVKFPAGAPDPKTGYELLFQTPVDAAATDAILSFGANRLPVRPSAPPITRFR